MFMPVAMHVHNRQLGGKDDALNMPFVLAASKWVFAFDVADQIFCIHRICHLTRCSVAYEVNSVTMPNCLNVQGSNSANLRAVQLPLQPPLQLPQLLPLLGRLEGNAPPQSVGSPAP